MHTYVLLHILGGVWQGARNLVSFFRELCYTATDSIRLSAGESEARGGTDFAAAALNR